MKIGILTFHWATNYGAVLQCYALQSFLDAKGHDVKIINYKPHRYDDNIFTCLRYRKFLHFRDYLNNRKKESALADFRNSRLHLTERVYSYNDIKPIASQFDVIISGSDQVVNPSFLMSGEGYGVISPTYFLGFPFNGKRIGYALSFGCITYPEKASYIARNYIKKFDIITVRENTGIDIMKIMGRDDAFVVPDPTMLQLPQFYHSLADECRTKRSTSYDYCFFIRHIAERKHAINNILKAKRIIWNNEDNDYTLQGWLNKIKHAEFVITDSFHCVVMCLKLHKPFVVITEHKGNIGMNDRLYTLLDKISLSERIIYKNEIYDIVKFQSKTIDWQQIDCHIIQINMIVNNIL